MASLKERIIDILLKRGLLTKGQIEEAIRYQREKGGKLKDILAELKFIDSKNLLSVVSESLNIPPINLANYKIDKEVFQLLPKEVISKYQVVPISKLGNILTIAMSDPLDIFAIDEIKAKTGCDIDVVIADKKDIEDAISANLGESALDLISKIADDIQQSKLEIVESKKEYEEDSPGLLKAVDEAPVVQITNMLINKAVLLKASDMLIEPMEDSLRIRYRIDGALTEFDAAPPKSMHNAIVSRLKVISQLDIAERRLPQDGRFKLGIEGREVDFRISIVPSRFGEKVSIRLLDKAQAMLDIDKLGMHESTLERLKKCASRPHGMILVCGQTGCGKTTTLYSILKYVNSIEKNLVTVEDPVEYQIKGINQVNVNQEVGLTFARCLRAILRQDPDVIMVGEIRDYETVDIAIKSALTGHLVLSTLHTNTACASVVRLINMGVEPFLIASSVICILAQRLVRKICLSCRQPYKVSDDILKKIAADISKDVFYKGAGCKHCNGTGFKGRIAIAELLVLDNKINRLIVKKASEEELKEQAVSAGMVTLRKDGLAKAIGGLTTLNEVISITSEDKNGNKVTE